jgi:hypothetical protein
MAILQLRLHSHAAPQLGSLKAKLAANIRQAMILGEPVATRCRPVSPGCRKVAAYAMAIFTLRTFSDPRAMRPSSIGWTPVAAIPRPTFAVPTW